MRIFFAFMLLLLGIRVIYHSIIVINPFANIFKVKDIGIYNLTLLVPYITEVLFNLVIFYFNFMLPDSFSSGTPDPKPNNRVSLLGMIEENTDDSALYTKNMVTNKFDDMKSVMSGSVRAWGGVAPRNNRITNPAHYDGDLGTQGSPNLNNSRDVGTAKFKSKVNNYHQSSQYQTS